MSRHIARHVSWWTLLFLAGILVLLGNTLAVAEEHGTLDRVEQRLKSDKTDEHPSPHYHYSAANAAADTFWDLFLNFLFAGVSSGWEEGMTWSDRHKEMKQEFYPGAPTLRFEGDYQRVVSSINGYHLNGIAGYLPFAVEMDFVHYFETNPTAQLKVMSPRFLFRSNPWPVFEIDLAMGAKIIRGRETHTGVEFGLPLYFYFGHHVIWDIKTYFATIHTTDIVDVASGLSFKWKLIGGRAAYRLIDVGGEKIHGPEVGVFVQW